MVRAMYPMAESTVFNHRIVFPQEGTPFFRMAGIAIVVNRVLLQTGWPNGTMGVVAVTANQLVFANRVGGSLVGLGADILVAAITDFRLGGAFQYFAGFVQHVAANTGHVFALVMTAMPVQQMGVALVTFQAYAVLCFQRRRAFAAKADDANIFWVVGVVAARAMTGFAALGGI